MMIAIVMHHLHGHVSGRGSKYMTSHRLGCTPPLAWAGGRAGLLGTAPWCVVCVGPADGLRDGAAQYQCAYCAVLLSTPFRSAEPIAAGDRGPLYYIGWERHSPGPGWVHCRLLGEWFVLILL